MMDNQRIINLFNRSNGERGKDEEYISILGMIMEVENDAFATLLLVHLQKKIFDITGDERVEPPENASTVLTMNVTKAGEPTIAAKMIESKEFKDLAVRLRAIITPEYKDETPSEFRSRYELP